MRARVVLQAAAHDLVELGQVKHKSLRAEAALHVHVRARQVARATWTWFNTSNCARQSAR